MWCCVLSKIGFVRALFDLDDRGARSERKQPPRPLGDRKLKQ